MTTENGGDPGSSATRRGEHVRRSDGGASIDVILGVLANRRRRNLLEYLRDRSRATVDDLIDHLQERESVGELEAGRDGPSRDDVELTLVHIHLPKLADAGAIEYDERNREVRYRGDERLDALLDGDRGEPSE